MIEPHSCFLPPPPRYRWWTCAVTWPSPTTVRDYTLTLGPLFVAVFRADPSWWSVRQGRCEAGWHLTGQLWNRWALLEWCVWRHPR